MANLFANGQLVVLKSGGPPMTVDAIPDPSASHQASHSYLCVWFKGASRESGWFKEHLLEAYVPPKKPGE